MQTPVMDTLRWMRVIGDTVFAIGIVALSVFVAGLATGRSYKSDVPRSSSAAGLRPRAT